MKSMFIKILKVIAFLYFILLTVQLAFFFGDKGTTILGFPYYPFGLFIGQANGQSMEPTLANKEIFFLNPFDKNPEPGKIMSLEIPIRDDNLDDDEFCSFIKEALPGNDYDLSSCKKYPIINSKFIKRIKKIDSENCIWFEGDNTVELSSDSRQFGWFCPGEFKIEGTVIFKD